MVAADGHTHTLTNQVPLTAHVRRGLTIIPPGYIFLQASVVPLRSLTLYNYSIMCKMCIVLLCVQARTSCCSGFLYAWVCLHLSELLFSMLGEPESPHSGV